MQKFGWVTLLLTIPLILVACGSSAPPEPLEMTINLREFAFEPDELEFQVGQEVILHLTNSGSLEHEIMFGRDVMMTDGNPNGYMIDMFESAGVEPVITVDRSDEEGISEEEHMEEDEHMEGDEHGEDEHMEGEHDHAGFMVQVPVTDDIYTMSFTVTEDMLGEWEIGCFLLDGVHYILHMVGTLTVIN